MLVDEGWLTEFVDCTRRFPNAAGFGGIIEPWFPHKPDAELMQAFHWLQIGFCGTAYDAPEGALPPEHHLIGANFGFALGMVRDREFSIRGNQDCLARGYDRTGFFEINTGQQHSWTVEINDNSKTGVK